MRALALCYPQQPLLLLMWALISAAARRWMSCSQLRHSLTHQFTHSFMTRSLIHAMFAHTGNPVNDVRSSDQDSMGAT